LIINYMKGEYAMKKICISAIVVCVLLCLSGCKQSQEEQTTTEQEQPEAAVEKEPERPRDIVSNDATLTMVPGSGNTLGIDLTNKIAVRGVQFTITGAKIAEVRTTPRTESFSANSNKESGIVILLSLTGNTIAPGTGAIAEISYEAGGTPVLADIKIGK
jgi:hypothetical protein